MTIKIIEENNVNSANFLENMPIGVLNVSGTDNCLTKISSRERMVVEKFDDQSQ